VPRWNFFQSAADKDPTFAAAYAGIAVSYNESRQLSSSSPASEVMAPGAEGGRKNHSRSTTGSPKRTPLWQRSAFTAWSAVASRASS